MPFRKALHLPSVLALLCAFGCSRDLRDVLDKYQPIVAPKLATLVKIRDAAKAAPPVTNDAVVLSGPAPKVSTTYVNGTSNVAIEYLEDLEDLQAYGNVAYRISSAGSMNRCAAALATHREVYSPVTREIPSEIAWYTADDVLEHCAQVRYVFVIRSLAFTEPSAVREFKGPCPKPAINNVADAGPTDAGVTDAGSSSDTCYAFTGGYFKAEVLVYDINTAQQVGGFRYVAESSPQVDIGASSLHSMYLATDFGTKVRSAFSSAVEKWVPSVVMN